MTRSIFDPTGPETEHSGSRNLGPTASDISHMPPDLVDGVLDCEGEDDTVDLGPLEPARTNPAALPEEDAPQESDVIDDPQGLMEGQPGDDSDAPQESPQ
jgi:hypothetical protein